MAIYAIGDVQGCYKPLRRLLDRLQFNPDKDKLWFAGDLVNRGPDSLKVLRFVKKLSEKQQAFVVLGNHDIRLIAIATLGRKRANRVLGSKSDTLDRVLKADDCDELVFWLRQQPLAHYDKRLNTLMIHAGLPPQWRLKRTLKCAQEVHAQLVDKRHAKFLRRLHTNRPNKWRKSMRGMKRLRFITNSFIRTRFVDKKGRLDFLEKGPPGSQPKRMMPWFEHPERKTKDVQIVFGHWASLGVYRAKNILALDSGCVWGGSLTAARLDGDQEIISVRCK